MPYISITLMAATAITLGTLAAVQAKQGGEYNAQAAENQAKANQQLDDYNAAMAEREAGYATDEARQKEALQRNENNALLAKQRALYGKSGVMLSEGTPLAVLGDSSANGELAALEVRRQGEVERSRNLMLAENYKYQGNVANMIGKSDAALSRWSGNNAMWGNILGIGKSLLSSGSQGYQAYSSGNSGAGSSMLKDSGGSNSGNFSWTSN